MGYLQQNKAFIDDKHHFFATLRQQKDNHGKIAETERLANNKNYQFLLNNQSTLEAEFKQMFAVLKNQKGRNEEAFWMYCYYCATLLEMFYKSYSQQGKEEEYKRLKQQIKEYLLKVENKKAEEEQSFIQFLEQSFLNGLRNLAKIPFHLSVLRDYVAFSNLCRVYWVFCRLTLTNGLLLARELHWIDALDSVLGMHTDVDQIIAMVQAPNGVLNYFSVGLFLARFLIDGGLAIRHIFFPNPGEENSTAVERLCYELKKRHCNFINDLIWALINFLTNFNKITGLSGPVAGALTAIFLGFDLCMFLYKRYLAQQEYLTKKAQYLQQIAEYSKCTHLSADERLQHINMLNKQMAELEIDWQTKEATLHFAMAAASLFVLGFSSALIFTPPGIILASFFVCTLGAAMYLSIGSYSKYQESSLRLQQSELTGDNLAALRKQYEAARNEFIFTLVKNAVVPTFLVATFAICWPAAIALTVTYVGFEVLHSLYQHSKANEMKQLPPIIDEEVNEHCFCSPGISI